MEDWPGKVDTKHAENRAFYRIPTPHTINIGYRILKVPTELKKLCPCL
jgi:hypothetical protein